MTPVSERFLRYVQFNTTSDESSETCPSTANQKLLGAALVEEMKAMGIEDAYMDENGYVYGTVPGDPRLPTIGLIAHMDTSSDASGENIKARIVEYNGGDVCLNEEKNIFLREKDYPSLKRHHGKHLIVTDGTTLLGADDKAGIAEIMTAAEFLLTARRTHATLKIGFTPTRKSAGVRTSSTSRTSVPTMPTPPMAVPSARLSLRTSTLPPPRWNSPV